MFEEDIRKRNNLIMLIGCLAAVVLAAVVLSLKFKFVLDSNDDAMLRAIASGSYTGKPDAHLIYMMFPLGLIFKILYSIAPGVMWYDGIMCFIHFACLFLIVYRVSAVFKRLSNRITAAVITYVFVLMIDLNHIVLHQYTVLAGVCVATGILWAGTYDFSHKDKISPSVITITMILGLWLRKQVFLLGLPILAAAVAYRVFARNETVNERFERVRAAVVPTVVFSTIAVTSFLVEVLAYSSPEWKAFKEYNAARTDVYDYNKLPDYDDNADLYGSLNLDLTDYTVLREYDVAMVESPVDASTFRAFSERADKLKKEWEQFYSVPRKVMLDTMNVMYGKNASLPGLLLTIVGFALLVLLVIKDEKLAGIILVGAYAYNWAFTAVFMYLERLPERVTFGFYLMELMLIVSIFVTAMDRERTVAPSAFWQVLVGGLLIAIVAFTGLSAVRSLMDADSARYAKATEWSEINAYFKANPDNVYVLNTSVSAPMPAYMFTKGEEDAFNLIKPGNWALSSLVEAAHLEKLIDTSVSDALTGSDNVFFVMNAERGTDWLEERFGSVKLTDSFAVGDSSYSVYSVGK